MRPQFSSGLLDRTVQQRDARLFVIALEGEEVGEEYVYFDTLERDRLVDCARVKLHLLPGRGGGDSAPNHVLGRIEEFKKKYKPRIDRDQFWLVLDRDRWLERNLDKIAHNARRRGYQLAVSNPCFELWLLLHETDTIDFLMGLDLPKRSKGAKRHLGTLRAAVSSRLPITLAGIHAARERARALDNTPKKHWPTETGTRVYRLIDALVAAGVLTEPAVLA